MALEGQYLGRYHLLHLLGSGGMGEVYLAEDARISQQVAIKVIRSEGIAYPQSESAQQAARLFEREARAIARLDHPNILPLYAYGEETLHGMPLTYLVMPYRKEGTLASWLRLRGSDALLTLVEVAFLVKQAADALQHAHDQQVIHQDIKPTNFLVRLRPDQPNHPDLLLADFGIAKLTSATASASQSIRGTPTYMAPEQWEGHPVPATDQYALAIMVYELLVGQPPFQGGPGQVMHQHFMTPPPAPSILNPRLSPAIDAVLLRALSKRPEQRFPSVVSFAQAFQVAMQRSGELHATLAISQEEAKTGTIRYLTLPGGRNVSVTIPAGVGDGTTLRLEGQGMPYNEGNLAGPLVLTIRISATELPLLLQQGGTAPTVAALLPYLQRPTVDGTLEPPARPAAPGHMKPTLPASHARQFASTVFATNATLPPTELATSARYTVLPTGVTGSSTPPSVAVRPETMGAVKPVKRSVTRRFVLLGLVVLVIVTLTSGIVWFTAHPTAPTGGPHTPTGGIHVAPAGRITEFPLQTANTSMHGITAGPDGNLWFTEFYPNSIGRLSPSGTIREFPLPVIGSNPDGIVAGPGRNLWFTEYRLNKIGRISPNGTISEFPIPTASSGPTGITAGPDGNLWFIEYISNQIGRISPSGTITEWPLPTPRSFPYEIAAGPDGNLWFTEASSNQIGRISPIGTISEFPIPTPNSSPGGIAAGPDGNLWFTERAGNKIGRISPIGTITEFPLPTLNSGPTGIAAGPDGNLWFIEYRANKVGRITSGK